MYSLDIFIVKFKVLGKNRSIEDDQLRANQTPLLFLDSSDQVFHLFTDVQFDIATILTCARATVHIQVNDINEYSPVFKEKSYKATVIEGKKYDSILKVEAVDADCSFQFSQICSYEIVTPDVPFTIDKDGRHLTMIALPCIRARGLSSTFPPATTSLTHVTSSIDPCKQRSPIGIQRSASLLSDNNGLPEISPRLSEGLSSPRTKLKIPRKGLRYG